jgi:hypothetical protein
MLLMATVASTVSAGVSVVGGLEARKQAKIAADQERNAAKDRADVRLQRFRELRANKRVAAAAAGANLSADEFADRFGTAARQRLIKGKGRIGLLKGLAGGGESLIHAAGSFQKFRETR